MVPKMESTYLVTYTYLEQNSYHNILISYGMTQRCRMNLPKNLLPAAKKPTRSGLQCVAKTDQGEQIKGWSGSSEYNSMFVLRSAAKTRKGSWSFVCLS